MSLTPNIDRIDAINMEEKRNLRARLATAENQIERLREELAEVDAMVAARRDSLDDRPRNEWPSNSIMEKAISRHESRVTQQSMTEPK